MCYTYFYFSHISALFEDQEERHPDTEDKDKIEYHNKAACI